MKALKHYKLLFDAECPMCRAYSNVFVKAGMLDNDGREAYQEMDGHTCTLVDKNRARNEIALVNTQTGEAHYGIDSIFTVIANNYSRLKPLFAFAPFKWLMTKLYFFISYNRKVIIPSNNVADNCIPDVNLKYRWAYLIFTWLITSLVLTQYSSLLTGVIPESKFLREFIICGGQIAFQSAVLTFLAKDKILQYLGNMMTISFAASLLLVVFVLIGKVLSITTPLFYVAIFMLVVGLMLLEHIRRMKLLGIHWFASASWVIYRIIVLIIILILS